MILLIMLFNNIFVDDDTRRIKKLYKMNILL